MKVDLSKFKVSGSSSDNKVRIILWQMFSVLFFRNNLPYPSCLKVAILRLFGAKVGSNVKIKTNVIIRYPWFLEIGLNSWLGEWVWIENWTSIKIKDNVCISQGVFITSGSHDYKKIGFDFMPGPIVIEDGVWIAAKAVICPGVTLSSHSVIGAGSVIGKNTQPYTVYKGNPAQAAKERKMDEL